MKSFIKSDYFLMLVSVLVSVLLWIYVVYVENPIHETSIKDVPIVYTNVSSDFENNKLVVLEGMADSVDIKVRGRRSALSNADVSKFTCNVNMSEVKESGTYTLPINFSSSVYGLELTQKKPNNVVIKVDKTNTREHIVTVRTTGTVKDGFVIGEITCEPVSVKLTGPQSILWTVEKAEVVVDVTGAESDIINDYKIKLYNENGTEITDSRISKNIGYCHVVCPVSAYKKLEITPLLSGETNSRGERITVTSIQPSTVGIRGDKQITEQIKEILTKPINVYDVTDKAEFTVPLDFSSLPEDAVADDGITEVTVTVVAEKTNTEIIGTDTEVNDNIEQSSENKENNNG